MRLTLAELADLPLASALIGRDGDIIVSTPEFRGAGPGSVSYRVRGNRLIVADGVDDEVPIAVLNRLLEAMDGTADAMHGTHTFQVRMLAAALRVLAGRSPDTVGTTDYVVDFASEGIRSRSALKVHVADAPPSCVIAPEVVALVLVQLAVNAERHSHATTVTLEPGADVFHVVWQKARGAAGITTSRRHADRRRWGLGFARIAADALGGAVYPPFDRGDGTLASTLEVGLERLALPVAAISGRIVNRATRAWDEETELPPGSCVDGHPRLVTAVEKAVRDPGRIAVVDGWRSRFARDNVWVAIPPNDVSERARDMIDGIAHERALWDGADEPARSRISALASLLGAVLGTPISRVPALAWNERMRQLAGPAGLAMPIPDCRAAGALDPQVVTYLASEIGERFEIDGDGIELRVRSECIDDPIAGLLVRQDRGTILVA